MSRRMWIGSSGSGSRSPSLEARASDDDAWLSLDRDRHDAELVEGLDLVEVEAVFDDEIILELDELNALVDDFPVGRGNVAEGAGQGTTLRTLEAVLLNDPGAADDLVLDGHPGIWKSRQPGRAVAGRCLPAFKSDASWCLEPRCRCQRCRRQPGRRQRAHIASAVPCRARMGQASTTMPPELTNSTPYRLTVVGA